MSEQEHKKGGIELSERELAQVVVIIILGAFFIFLAGYFLGKKRMCEELAQGDEVRFADKIHRALTNLANRSGEAVSDSSDSDAESDDEEESVENSTEVPVEPMIAQEEKTEKKIEKMAYAQLCGFSTEGAAKAYFEKLTKRGLEVLVVEKTSKSGRGRRVTWYQVVTKAMNKQDLLDLVEGIKKSDKLTSVTIVDLSE